MAGFIGHPIIWIEWLLSTLFDGLGHNGQCSRFLPVRLAGDGSRPSIAGLFGRVFQLVDDVPNDISQQAHSFFPFDALTNNEQTRSALV